jgi:hypothetical protein
MRYLSPTIRIAVTEHNQELQADRTDAAEADKLRVQVPPPPPPPRQFVCVRDMHMCAFAHA